MDGRESTYEDPFWEALHFQDEELSISKSIVARGQFGGSYMLGRVRSNKPLPPKVNQLTMMKGCNENETHFYNGLKAELNILYDLCHTNVIHLIGYCTEVENNVRRKVLIYEYCSNGNLIKVLQKGSPYFESGGTYSPTKSINNEILPEIYLNFCGWQLLRWATEIARGMEYLAFKGVVHGDLAARNILLDCSWVAKISNFGIGQRHNVQQKSYANQFPKNVLPLAWMAPETIQGCIYTESSDVWSYGVTLWEIYSLGEIPYKHDNRIDKIESDFWTILSEDIRPERPQNADKNTWSLMKSCWTYSPEARPTFSKLKTYLDRMVGVKRPGSGSSYTSSSTQASSVSRAESIRKSEKLAHKKKVAFSLPNAQGVLLGRFLGEKVY